MKKFVFTILAIILPATTILAQYNDPNFAIPASGYGSDGSHSVVIESFANPNFFAHPIKIYHPGDISTAVPTLFYSHAYGGTDPDNVAGVLEFIAKKGYAVVFVPYQTANTVTIPERYETLIAGFRMAAQDYPEIIDTTKVGFLGHSFGGAASFGISHQLFEDGWGANGRFIYALAQWYAYDLSPDDLDSFPADVKVLFEIFNDDTSNDHRMSIDIFNHINTPVAEKDFIMVSSSTVNGYNYVADHVVPNITAAYDALDYYAYYRLLDALCDYTFNGNPAGKDTALGHGSTAQITMPNGMGNLQEFEHPTTSYAQDRYTFPCDDEQNLRVAFCETTAGTANSDMRKSVSIYPNPASNFLNVKTQTATGLQISIYNSLGQQTGKFNSTGNSENIDISYLQRGVYFVILNGVKEKFIKI